MNNLSDLSKPDRSGYLNQGFASQPVFPSEQQGLEKFDEIATASGLFGIYRECWGWYGRSKPGTEASEGKRPRIDRILTPTKKLIAAGWTHGAIGVEGKAGDLKGGPPVCQCIDYAHSVFELASVGNTVVAPNWIFLWPFPDTFRDIGSIMGQNRVGVASYNPHRDSIQMKSNGVHILTFDRNGIIQFCKDSRGSKSGSR